MRKGGQQAFTISEIILVLCVLGVVLLISIQFLSRIISRNDYLLERSRAYGLTNQVCFCLRKPGYDYVREQLEQGNGLEFYSDRNGNQCHQIQGESPFNKEAFYYIKVTRATVEGFEHVVDMVIPLRVVVVWPFCSSKSVMRDGLNGQNQQAVEFVITFRR